MPYPDSVDVGVGVLGGYCSSMPPEAQPNGASPECYDMHFVQGGVRTRPALKVAIKNPTLANPWSGLAQYFNKSQQAELMLYDQQGNLFAEFGNGIASPIATNGTPGTTFDTTDIFGRLYMAFGQSVGTSLLANQSLYGGVDIPRQWDGVNYDRVSQVGPGAAPTPQNYLPPPASIDNTSAGSPVSIAASPTGLVLSNPKIVSVATKIFINGRWVTQYEYVTYFQTLTLTATIPHGLQVGQTAAIAGSGNTNFNANFIVATVPSATTATFSVLFESTPNSGGGTVTGIAASAVRQNNIVTINTAAPHGFQPGWYVQIADLDPNGLPGSVSSMIPNMGVLTVTMSAAHNLQPGAVVTITGASDPSAIGTFPVATVPSATVFTLDILTGNAAITGATIYTSFDGTFQISAIPSPTSFTYFQIDPDAFQSNTDATATIIGQISPGLHGVSVCFITRQGSITAPAPPVYWSANGGNQVSLTNIPTGPANVVARLLVFTPAILPPATTGPWYSLLPAMQINDNTTTSAIFDFLDIPLIAGFSANYLFTQIVLGECFGAAKYSSRTAWFGERVTLSNMVNLSFDGGWSLGTAPGGFDTPLGWTTDPVNGAGGVRATSLEFGDAYEIEGDGVSAIRGMIYQSAFQDYNNVTIFSNSVPYSCRITAFANVTTGPVTLVVDLFSPTQGLFGAADFTFASLTGDPQEMSTVLHLASSVAFPPDLLMRVYLANSQPLGTNISIDDVQPFPTQTPVNTSIVRVSYSQNPEGFDGVTGQITVTPNDGQQVRAAFTIRNNFYIAKDNYLAYATDDGVNEPANWAVNEVSNLIGCCGPNAWDAGEEWVVFVHRSGVYIFWGQDPVKISEEIAYDASGTGKFSWNDVNWAGGQNIWVKVDQASKKVYVGIPTGTNIFPNVTLSMDYQFAEDGEATAGLGAPSYSSYTGRVIAHGGARKWMPLTIAASGAQFSRRPDGSQQLYFASSTSGLIWDYTFSQTFDQLLVGGVVTNTAIDGYYGTYGSPDMEEESGLQLASHRKLVDYLTGYAKGVGTLAVVGMTAMRNYAIRGISLSLAPTGDWERPININSERVFWMFSTDAIGSWFQLTKVFPMMKTDPTTPVRGLEA